MRCHQNRITIPKTLGTKRMPTSKPLLCASRSALWQSNAPLGGALLRWFYELSSAYVAYPERLPATRIHLRSRYLLVRIGGE